MVKSFLPILFSSAGVAAAGVAGYFVFIEPNIPETELQPVAGLVSKPEAEIKEDKPKADDGAVETASLEPEDAKVDEPATEALVEPVLPEFTILRVDPDGNAVIAGTGPANREVELFDGEISIAKSKTGASGDFAFVLDRPLAPGLHQLTVEAIGKGGTRIASAQAGLINVPLPDKREELTVLITEPGEASRVLAKPEPIEEKEEAEQKELATLQPEPEIAVAVEGEDQKTETAQTADEDAIKKPENSDPQPEVESAKVELGELASDVSKVEVKTKTEDVACRSFRCR